jgi:hypothetical protein
VDLIPRSGTWEMQCALAGTWGSQSQHRARIMASLTATGNHGATGERPWT